MKAPEVGELWLDESAYKTGQKLRLVLVTGISDGWAQAHAITGGQPSERGIPVHYFAEGMTWQGYWSTKPARLPRLAAPFVAHPMSGLHGASSAQRLDGKVAVRDAILPSWTPDQVHGWDSDRRAVGLIDDFQLLSKVHASYLRFTYQHHGVALSRGRINTQGKIRELWYQRQQGGWFLVRTLASVSIELP